MKRDSYAKAAKILCQIQGADPKAKAVNKNGIEKTFWQWALYMCRRHTFNKRVELFGELKCKGTKITSRILEKAHTPQVWSEAELMKATGMILS